MVFDITNIDLKILTRALIAYSEAKNLGQIEYLVRKYHKDLVDSISDEDIEFELQGFKNLNEGSYRLFDYYKGKPIKLDLRKKSNGRIIAYSSGYDTRNGKYRFLEVLLDFFSHDEIKIVRKGYGHMEDFDFPKNRTKDEIDMYILKNLVDKSIKEKDEFGRFWRIDINSVGYITANERFLKE